MATIRCDLVPRTPNMTAYGSGEYGTINVAHMYVGSSFHVCGEGINTFFDINTPHDGLTLHVSDRWMPQSYELDLVGRFVGYIGLTGGDDWCFNVLVYGSFMRYLRQCAGRLYVGEVDITKRPMYVAFDTWQWAESNAEEQAA